MILHHFGNDYYFDKVWIQGKDYGYEFPVPDSVKSRERERMEPISVAANYSTVQRQTPLRPRPPTRLPTAPRRRARRPRPAAARPDHDVGGDQRKDHDVAATSGHDDATTSTTRLSNRPPSRRPPTQRTTTAQTSDHAAGDHPMQPPCSRDHAEPVDHAAQHDLGSSDDDCRRPELDQRSPTGPCRTRLPAG